MTIFELHYADGSKQTLRLHFDDIVAAGKIAENMRKAINKENTVKCTFTKVYTKEATK